MVRTILKPRWLALLTLVIGIVIGFTLLGLWQLDVAKSSAARDAAASMATKPEVPLSQVAHPHTRLPAEAVGRTVRVTGRYDPNRQVLIVQRRLDDRPGMWVVTPLVEEGSGAVIPVVRGFVTDSSQVSRPVPADRPVTVTGMLAPGESPPDHPVDLPAGQMVKLDLTELVNRWHEDMYSGFIFRTAQVPAESQPGSALAPIPPPSLSGGGIVWRNLAYAIQWWLFAAFAVYMWWRMVAEDHRRAQVGAGGVPGADPTESTRQPEQSVTPC